jgi:hypothetical protein
MHSILFKKQENIILITSTVKKEIVLEFLLVLLKKTSIFIGL